MKAGSLIGFALLAALAGCKQAAPRPARPAAFDAVVLYERPQAHRGDPSEETWYLHGDTIRIDASPPVGGPTQKYMRLGSDVTFSRSSTAGWESLTVRDASSDVLPAIEDRTFTGKTESHLGENCRVWEFRHPPLLDYVFVQTGCVTDKGIELWWRQGDSDTRVAKNITYKPVPASVVRPPFEALNIESWARTKAPADHRNDFQVRLESADPNRSAIVRTRSGTWLSEMRTQAGKTSRFSVEDTAAGLRLEFSIVDDRSRSVGDRSRYLSITRAPGRLKWPREPLPDKPEVAIFDEKCQWWDMAPGIADAGRSECLTSDDVPMAISTWSRGSHSELTARRLQRSPQTLSAAFPPEQFTTPSYWGLE